MNRTMVRKLLRICSTVQSQSILSRTICSTNACRLKEIVHTSSSDGKTITIEGVDVDSPRSKNLVDFEKLYKSGVTNHECNPDSNAKSCPLCRLGLSIKHTDVLILKQFLDPSGNLLQRNITSLCSRQHRRMSYLVQMAKLAGILKTPLDPEPKARPGFMKYNKYYDESVIEEWLAGNKKRQH